MLRAVSESALVDKNSSRVPFKLPSAGLGMGAGAKACCSFHSTRRNSAAVLD